jgi:hypothetical protein
MNPDGSGKNIIVSDCRYPDGIVVDIDAGTFTGPTWRAQSERWLSNEPNLDGRNRTIIVPAGGTHTP